MTTQPFDYLEERPAADAPIVDNTSGLYCSACRETGMSHCSDPGYCGGMRRMKVVLETPSGMMFPATHVARFRHDRSKGQRWGQAFYEFMALHKCETDRVFCDRLYNAKDDVAKAMVAERTDPNQ